MKNSPYQPPSLRVIITVSFLIILIPILIISSTFNIVLTRSALEETAHEEQHLVEEHVLDKMVGIEHSLIITEEILMAELSEKIIKLKESLGNTTTSITNIGAIFNNVKSAFNNTVEYWLANTSLITVSTNSGDLGTDLTTVKSFETPMKKLSETEVVTHTRISHDIQTGHIRMFALSNWISDDIILGTYLPMSEIISRFAHLNIAELMNEYTAKSEILNEVNVFSEDFFLLGNSSFQVSDQTKQAITDTFSGNENVELTDEFQGTLKRYLLVSCISNLWVIEVTYNLRVIDDQLSDLPTFVLLSGIFTVILTILIIFFVSYGLTDPLKRLVSDIDDVAKGRYEKEIQSQSSNELVILADSINRMVSSLVRNINEKESAQKKLRSINEELDELVQARTEELEYERQQLAVTLDSIGEGVITTDINSRIIRLNPEAEEITGWTQNEAIGQQIETVLETTVPDEPIDQTHISVETIPVAVLRTKVGKKKYVERTTTPIRDPNGLTYGTVIVLRDITFRYSMEQEILKAKKLESLGVLAGGIAHDFNNILTAIIGNLNLLEGREDFSDESLHLLKEAELAADKAHELSASLLTFSTGGEPIRRPIFLPPLIRDLTSLLFRGLPIKMNLMISSSLWPIFADESQVNQVFQNLLINAKEVLGEKGEVTITGENVVVEEAYPSQLSPGRYVKVMVQDNGPGIPEENLTKIFDPFFTTKTAGTGIGLAVVYSVVTKHNGLVTVESTVGEGTNFSLYLPASSASPPAKVVRKEGIEKGEGKILVMDDERLIREVLSSMLGLLGYDFTCSEEGREAIDLYHEALVQKQPFDLVILDLTVAEGKGGVATASELLKLNPEVKILVSSGFASDPVVANYQDYGFCGTLSKPYTLNQLSEVLQSLLSKKRN